LQVVLTQSNVRGNVGKRRLRACVLREEAERRLDPDIVLRIHETLSANGRK
jgi:hypothetical protein